MVFNSILVLCASATEVIVKISIRVPNPKIPSVKNHRSALRGFPKYKYCSPAMPMMPGNVNNNAVDLLFIIVGYICELK